MDASSIREEFWIPIDIKHIKKVQKGLVVDPKHAIVYIASTVQIVMELCLHLWGPIFGIKIRKVAFPASTAPWIFEKQ